MRSFHPHDNLFNKPYLIAEKTESLRSLAGLSQLAELRFEPKAFELLKFLLQLAS